ncbi:MAG: fused MFS/spermidine synthase [bacterium]|nr:fused MFS/spermidine synthase [bacterium]
MKNRIVFAIIITGLSGVIGQLLFIRELLIVFHGNEFSIGIVLANWLLLEGLGALLISRIRIFKNRNTVSSVFVLFQLVFSVYLPIAVLLIRNLKSIFGIMPAETLGLLPIFYSSFLFLLPASICHGALFTLCCKLYDNEFPNAGGKSIGVAYIYETAGSIIGSLLFSIVLVRYFDSFYIVFGVMILNVLMVMVLQWGYKSLFSKVLNGIAIILFVSGIYFIFKVDKIRQFSVSSQFLSKNVVFYKNSIYGNTAVIKSEEQYSFLYNGVPNVNVPVPDVSFIEDFVNFPLLSHPAPESVLIIGGGAGGVIDKILKYDITSIDYLELDPLLISTIKQFPTPMTSNELSSERVHIKYEDGRLFLRKKEHGQYDLIFIGVSDPVSLQSNRFFTEEFFKLAGRRLNPGGILTITLPGSLEYMGKELADLNLCIYTTIKKVYPYVKVIPGDFNMFLCSNSDISVIPDTILKHLTERGVESSVFTEGYVKYRLDSYKEKKFLSSISKEKTGINRDSRPIGVFYSLAYWSALFNPGMDKVFNLFLRFNLWFFVLLVGIISLCFFIISIKRKNKGSQVIIPFCIFTTGFTGMVFSLAIIFAFQSVYGYVFKEIGILTAAFMGGGLVGGLITTVFLREEKKNYKSLIFFELCLVLFALLFRFIIVPWSLIFVVLCFVIGLLVSAEFPLANKIYLENSVGIERSVGVLYLFDLLGGWFAGLITGIIMLPVMGLWGTCVAVAVLKISSMGLIKQVTINSKKNKKHRMCLKLYRQQKRGFPRRLC